MFKIRTRGCTIYGGVLRESVLQPMQPFALLPSTLLHLNHGNEQQQEALAKRSTTKGSRGTERYAYTSQNGAPLAAGFPKVHR